MTAAHPANTPRTSTKLGTPVQTAALAVGAVFLVVGVLGPVPGITTNYDQLTFAGHHSNAGLLGIFNVSVLHNLVHLVSCSGEGCDVQVNLAIEVASVQLKVASRC